MKIIINADDFGLSKDVNEAIDICITKGYIQRTTLMVNMPYTDEAVSMARTGKYLDKIGLHLNLIEGIPLTSNIKKTKLCNENGEFSGLFFKNMKNRILVSKSEKDALTEEIEAQMNKFIRFGFSVLHLDSHQHSHVNNSILFIVINLAKKYGFQSIRLSRNLPKREIKGFKKIYKDFVNEKIISYNNLFYNEYKEQFFGSKRDYEVENVPNKEEYKNTLIEVMVHPVISNGIITDNFTGEKLFDERLQG